MGFDLSELFDLRGKRAIVTGGGQGIGRATARLLAQAGARVVIASRGAAEAEAAATAMRGESLDITAMALDVTSEASVVSLFAKLEPPDILINNAGITPKAALVDMSAADWDAIHGVNLRGAFLCMREAARGMIGAGRGGRIVNVSSISALHPGVPGNTAYAASKGGMNALTRAAALELASHNITVNAVLPGATRTEGAERKRQGAPIIGPAADAKRYLFGRPSEAHEPAAAILFFASPAAAMVTGQLLAIDGGFLVG